MKKILLSLLFSVVVLSSTYAQPYNCSDITFLGGNAQAKNVNGAPGLGRFCAPVTVDWYVTFNAIIPAGANVEISVDWGNGIPTTYTATNSGNTWFIANGNGNTFIDGPQTYDGINNARHTYPEDLGVCDFNIIARLVIDGNICTASSNSNEVDYWDTDEDNPGNVSIEPILYQVCAGDQVTINFEDNTTFNCVNPGDTDNPNEEKRNVRWTYNTIDGAAPDGRIDGVILSNGVTLDGSNAGDQNYIPPQADVAGSDVNTIEEYPAVVGPGDAVSTSLDITVPSSATVGEVFEVKLENWGPCNPLGGPIPVIERYALIRIVAPPQNLSFTISKTSNGSPQKTTFCPGENIRFRGDASNHNADFRYSWRVYDGPNDTDPVVFARNNDRYTWLDDEGADLNTVFSTAGTKLVRMFVRNSDSDLEGNCEVFFDRTITITATPIAVIGFNDGTFGSPNTSDNLYEVCLEDLGTDPLELTLTDESTGKSVNTTTTWLVEKTIPAPTVPLAQHEEENSAATFNYPNNPLIISEAGEYRIRLYTEDAATSCTSVDELFVYVYDTPEASFDASEVCAGNNDPLNKTEFSNIADNLSGITARVNNDEIVKWMWDFSYDAVAGFNNEKDESNNNTFRRFLDGTDGAEPTASVPGDYEIALIVETTQGCRDTIVHTVTVKHNPVAELEASYRDDYDTYSAGDTYAGDPICPGTFLNFTNITDETLNDASLNPVTYEIKILDFLSGVTTETIGAPGAADETIETNIFFNETASNQNFKVVLVATGNNSCQTVSDTINIVVLPEDDANFNIFDGDPLNVSDPPDLYDPGLFYCAPFTFYFKTDANTETFNADEYVWTVTDAGTGIVETTATVVRDPLDETTETFSFNFENEYPSTSERVFKIELEVITDNYCVSIKSKEVKLRPQPTANFSLTNTITDCPSVQYKFEAQQSGLDTYNWSTVPNDPTILLDEIGGTSSDTYIIELARPASGDLNFTVTLTTTSLAGCTSETVTYNGTLEEPEDIEVETNFSATVVSSCLPAVYNWVNATDPTPFALSDFTWEFQLSKFNGTVYVLEETFEGEDYTGNTDFAAGIDYEFTEPGDYQLDLIATATSQCVTALSAPIEFTIYDTPEVKFRTNINEGCSPLENVTIQGTSSNVSGNGGDFDMHYEVRNASNSNLVQSGPAPADMNGLGDQLDGTVLDPLINTTDPFIDYDITIFAEGPGGCTDDSTYTVRVFQQPLVDFTTSLPNPACEEDYEFTFEVNPSSTYPAGTEFRWNFGDGASTAFSSSLTSTHQYNNPEGTGGSRIYPVELIAKTPEGCITTSSPQDIELNPLVRSDFFLLGNSGCSPFEAEIRANAQGTGISGNYIYERRLAGTSSWTTFTPDNDGNVTEAFINDSDPPSNQVYEIRLIVSGDGSCSDTSAIRTVTVFPEPINPTEIIGAETVCENESTVRYEVDHRAGYTYQWSVPEFAYISATELPDRNVIFVNYGNEPESGSSEVSVRVTNANFCPGDLVTLPVSVIPGPTGSIALSGPGTICPGDSTEFTFTLDGPGSLGFDVVLSNGFGVDTLIENVQSGDKVWVKPTASVNYNLTEVIDREFDTCPGQASNDNVRVNVNIAPTAIISGDATICEGESTDLRVNLSGLGPWDIEYTDGTDTVSVNSNTPAFTIPVSPVDSTVYKLVSVSDNSCKGTVSADSATILVNPAPDANIFVVDNVGEVCVNETTQLGVSLFGYGPWSIRFTDGMNIFAISDIQPISGHDPTDPNSSTLHVFDIVPENDTTVYTLLEVADKKGCIAPGSGNATIYTLPTPEVSMTGNTSICAGSSTPLHFEFASGVAPFTVEMAINDVEDTVTLSGLQNGHEEIVTPSETTNYRVFSVTDANGCPAYNFGLPVRVNVREMPTVVLSASDSICYGEEASLRFDLTGKGPWTITYNDGSQNRTFNTPFNRHFETVAPTVTTDYTVVSVKDSNTPQCTNSGTGSARVVVAPELVADFIATPTNMDLPTSTITITNTTTNKSEWDYTWDFGDGNFSDEQDPGSHTYETYGTYFVRMTASNGDCTDNTQTIITINAIPAIVDFTADPIEGCAPLTVDFENLTRFATASTYLWDFGDNQSSRVIHPQHTYDKPGTYTVRLSANNITGQAVEAVKTAYITVFESPQSIFRVKSGFEEVFTGEKVEFVNSSTEADQFLWDFGDGNESFQEEPVHVYADSGIYDITLVAINSETGCTDTLTRASQVLVLTGGESVVANAFTPSRGGPGTASNDPQRNDMFLPLVKGVEKYDMKIYNRWGELIFESNDKEVGWDGYYKGELMPMGVYVFRMELLYENGRREVKLGDVTLIR
ncbi:PKD domain-containing protein [Marivirga sp. S37H4]|uniref:PKD domain-containing protein n=1 Tax=Marivirga aurantiaca TaxID=2802615 RepID=A0A934WWM8_9BACT|nr:PKD domain-containing protein [Marivirga aurantiaca]MBK6264240.1 PKD domain-containing protein [Marivirga aurantiaca]